MEMRRKSEEDLENKLKTQGRKVVSQVMVRHLQRDGEDEVEKTRNGNLNVHTQAAESSIHAPSTCTDTN